MWEWCREALSFMTVDPTWKRKVAWGGLLMLLFPPLGWVLALGYRSVVGQRLVEGLEPLLPDWKGNYVEIFRRGVKSVAVILTYYLPFLVAYVLLAISGLADLWVHWFEIAAFFALIAFFPPLFLPSLPFLYPWYFPWMSLNPGEVTVLLAVFLASTFVLPAAFTQIALTGRYASAYRWVTAVKYARDNVMGYLLAWGLSLAVSAVAVATVVFTPWLLFWSYLVILFAFTELLSRLQRPDVRARFLRSKLLPRRPTAQPFAS